MARTYGSNWKGIVSVGNANQRLVRTWGAGHDARSLGVQLSANPFCEGTPEHDAWRKGWLDIDLDSETEPQGPIFSNVVS